MCVFTVNRMRFLTFVIGIYDKVIKDVLRPLSVSIGISMGRSKTPILQLYRAMLSCLRIF